MIEVLEWSRLYRSLFERWPSEPNRLLPAFLLRSDDEPYDIPPHSFAIMFNGILIGRFSYRLMPDYFAFVGIVLSPDYRGLRLSADAMRACIIKLSDLRVKSVFCSVAVANIPSHAMLSACGFFVSSLEWRDLPAGFDVNSLVGFPLRSYRLEPAPAMLYSRMFGSVERFMYADVA